MHCIYRSRDGRDLMYSLERDEKRRVDCPTKGYILNPSPAPKRQHRTHDPS
jgi:hypothetical protein